MTRNHLVGLVGKGIGTSLSPALHHAEAAHLGIAYTYALLDADGWASGTKLSDILSAAKTLGFAGLNITHPYKQEILEHLDDLSAEAEAIGAVNTVTFAGSGAVGHNTDAYGYQQLALRSLVGERTGRVVQFGAGGAGSAVAHGHLEAIPGHLHILDIDDGRARCLAERLAARFGDDRVGWGRTTDAVALLADADGFVNATPMGMAAHPGSPVPPGSITGRHWVIDIVYMPLRTQLMLDAERVGARVTGGAAMTVHQAARAFELFTGVHPDSDRMLAHMNREVAARLTTDSNR